MRVVFLNTLKRSDLSEKSAKAAIAEGRAVIEADYKPGLTEEEEEAAVIEEIKAEEKENKQPKETKELKVTKKTK